ncbi:hypothetical protein ACFL27_07725 [candidate division CSSED10-310 bacterium]|uniref:Uncharacterized protein n=1 Tax=candidate division CSSED10-310 bacterium TaxID=2855610 RepID=A0ABV6YV67_UNCC1
MRLGKLTVGLLGVLFFMAGLHCLSGHLPGMTGQLIKHNQVQDLEVYAYFYSEVGDIRDFLDDEQGKYGKEALQNLNLIK